MVDLLLTDPLRLELPWRRPRVLRRLLVLVLLVGLGLLVGLREGVEPLLLLRLHLLEGGEVQLPLVLLAAVALEQRGVDLDLCAALPATRAARS